MNRRTPPLHQVLLIGALAAIFQAGDVRADSSIFEGRRTLFSLMAGLPGGTSLAGEYRAHDRFSLGASLGGLSIPLRGNNGFVLTLGTAQIDLRGRWHPFGGSFFFGVATGARSMFARGTQSILVGTTPVPTEVEVRINNVTLTPHFGWIWVIGRGFSFGLELGAQVPFAPNTALTTTISNPLLSALLDLLKATADYQNLEAQVNMYGTQIGRYVLPYVAFRAGWAFDIVDGKFRITDAPN